MPPHHSKFEDGQLVHLRVYRSWDRAVRAWHWVNVVCVVLLSLLGTAIYFTGSLGLSLHGNHLLKAIHVAIGYVFALNLTWRLVWGFVGSRHARWKGLLPIGHAYFAALREYLKVTATQQRASFIGHTLLGRLAVTAMLLVLASQGASGLILAGTDLYMPPLGNAIATYIAADGIDPRNVGRHVPESISIVERARMLRTVDDHAYRRMVETLRRPSVLVHRWSHYLLLLMIVVHIGAVVREDAHYTPGLISAMFTGRKLLASDPLDAIPIPHSGCPRQRGADPGTVVPGARPGGSE